MISKEYVLMRSKKMYIIFWLCLMTIIFVSLFSYSTSPFYHMYGNADSAIFQTIGAFWFKGKLPYVDLWDHKGPLIFALNAVGYGVGGKYGVFALQIICLLITLSYIYKMARLKSTSSKALFIVFLSLIKLGLDYEEGNYTEEYMLPFIAASLFGMLCWSDEKKSTHSIHYAFIYGLCAGAGLLTRITNALPIFCGVFFIFCVLLKYRKYFNLVCNAISFLLGFCTLVVPFISYFLYKGILHEMWYGMIGYNLTYVKHTVFGISSKALIEIIRILVAYFCSIVLFIICNIMIVYDQYNRRLLNMSNFFWCFISVGMLFLFFLGNGYMHYGIIEMPLVAICAHRLYELKNVNIHVDFERYIRRIFAWGGLFLCIISGLWGIKRVVSACYKHDNREYHITLLDYIPENEKNSFIAWHCPNWIYLEEDIAPYYKYFILQSWHAFNSEELSKEIYETFSEGDVEWILINDAWSNYYPTIIQDIIEERYSLVKCERYSETEDYYLYRLQE